MPELPEVETVRRGLQQRTGDFTVARVEVLRQRAVASPAAPGAFEQGLQHCSLAGWQRRGKYLLGKLQQAGGPAGWWGVHLRMTGQFLWLNEDQPPCSHTRVRIWNQRGEELRFVDTRSFGQMWWVPPGSAPEQVITGLQRLGPEPFAGSFNADYLRERLRGSRRPIKAALLDQALVAGVGNIYADEALFSAGIRPRTPSGTVSRTRLERLHRALVEVLETSIGAGGTTFSDFRDLTGRNGNYGGIALVYRRSGQPCRSCGTSICREKLGGRSSHWCPRCQH